MLTTGNMWGLAIGLIVLSLRANASSPPKLTNRDSPAYQLGKMLFFDPVLSGNQKRSCASCHRPQKAFTDHRITARGFQFTNNLSINTPTILNVAGQTRYFHDGRAASLNAVIDAVITNPNELNTTYPAIVAHLQHSLSYRRLFRRAFGQRPDETTIKQSLVAYLRQQNTLNSQYDHHKATNQPLNPLAMAGLALFEGAANCTACHCPPLFQDQERHLVWRTGVATNGAGAFELTKTPGLRNVALTLPYGADGSAPTLDDVLLTDFHRQQLPKPLTSHERLALVAFLHTLTDTASADNNIPQRLPRIKNQLSRTVSGQY